MSMNQYMHPRNIYKEPPNFKQLALEYPTFRKYTKTDVSGKVSIDFKNVEALRALSVTLLKKDFDLNLDIPLDKLIPTIPLRLNYILWIEDLVSIANRTEEIKGIDIGTGASCVYPLIAARKNNWSMLATEIDSSSIEYANKNVSQNCLDNLIKITKVNEETLLEEVLAKFPGDYDFCMCNPPFFGSTQELHPFFKSRKQNRPHPKNAFCASVDEVVVKGGEVEYISKLVNESKLIAGQIKIYTTMIGHKSSLPALKKLLREVGVVSFKQTEFCQGNTTRWGLAWTFLDIDLRKIPGTLLATKHHQKPLIYALPKFEICKLDYVVEKIQKIFNDLQFKVEDCQKGKNYVEFVITAYSNTWSHQRRQRREKMRLNNNGELNNSVEMKSEESNEIDNACSKLAEMDLPSEGSKKRALDDDGFYDCKRLKTGDNKNDNTYLKARIKVAKVETDFGMELHFIEGTGTKESLHQVLQYIKNQFKELTAK